MKLRRYVLLFMTMILSGGTVIYAASNNSAIAVYFNNVLQDREGLLSEGEAYLSVDQLSDTSHTLVSWDESRNTVNIYKPNVNIAVLDDDQKIFGGVKGGSRNTFTVFVQVDNLQTDISDLKIEITDPNDETKTIQTQHIEDKKEKFWFRSSEFDYTFSAKGDYPIRVYLKDTASKDWFPVGELQIPAV
ncbi:hypothetical protein ACFOLF_11205 [Paenibacillus sepulcri]|uniref:Copper amine oxidase n=1 Tax=Paenibacillus sepulcri TaxID=359917 RepID=A0ABS7BZI4_9BACL|nr:hypothetical protein [Paenibacillus sepulcri]